MLKNYLAAALRNLARNRLYAAISIFGLAVGMCAALLTGLVIRNQLSYEHFIPGYEHTYTAVTALVPQGRPKDYNTATNEHFAIFLKLRFKEVASAARVAEDTVRLARGQIEAQEPVYWADENLFSVLPLPVVAGQLHTALQRSDGIVLTRSAARKYFGRDAPLGESIQVDRTHLMTVTAVIEDLPFNGTTLSTGIFISGLSQRSTLPPLSDAPRPPPKGFFVGVRTFFRLAPGASIEPLQSAVPEFLDIVAKGMPQGIGVTMELMRFDKLHVFSGLNSGIEARLRLIAVIGTLVLLIACINFVNLTTARSSKRATEIAMRKVSGANRRDLVLQLLGESAIQVGVATVLAMMFCELLLPHVNAFLQSGATFEYWREPRLLLWILSGAVLIAIAAGMYPAFVLSSFRPRAVLKRATTHSSGANLTRSALVTLQFTILIVLAVAAVIAYQQRIYATREALRVSTDQHLMIQAQCTAALKNELSALPGVRGAACTSYGLLNGQGFFNARSRNGTDVALGIAPVDSSTFNLFDLRPIAGRFLEAPRDEGPASGDPYSGRAIVINETAAQRLGYPSPAAAIGQFITAAGTSDQWEIAGVVKDFAFHSVEQEIGARSYILSPRLNNLIHVKLTGQQIPETLTAIDALARKLGVNEPVIRFFLNDYIQSLYIRMLREAQIFAVLSTVAILLACLGLVGLSAASTDRRTKEIGIRKAMGADTSDVVRLMVWQFTKPVLWAGAIALPVSALLMNRWLEGFAYHIDLTPWPFFGAATAAWIIAVLTVTAHCYSVARAKPVSALRYE